MKTYTLHKLLNKHDELKDRRHPMFEKNRFIRFIAYFMVAYYAAILLFLGVMLPQGMGDPHTGVAAFHVFDSGFYIILITDFWLRFLLQETPAQQAKPYALLPVRQSFLMKRYLIKAALSTGNLFWGFMLVPFAIIGVLPHLGWSGALAWLLGYWLMIVANSYMYLLTRAACTRHILWFLLPVAIHGGVLCAAFLPDTNLMRSICTIFICGLAQWQLWAYAIPAALIAIGFWCNYGLQRSIVYEDVAKKEDVKVTKTSRMAYLNRFGAMGEYLKMEIKLRMRNKQVKIQFITGVGAMCLLSGIMYFTPAYDGEFMTSFICLYNYIVLGMMTLITIMGYEGNYIDGLMSRRESILSLLTAKYYFNSLLLLVPITINIPLMVAGKISLWMNLGYLFFTIGVLYPIIFQMAVYNKDTLPLNNKLTGKQSNMSQTIISFAILFVPIGIEKVSLFAFGTPWGYAVMILLGILGIATHHIWLRHIYRRLMARRYENMEGFRASRP